MKSISLFIGTLVFYLFLVGFVNAQTERKYTYQALDIQLPPGTVKIIELADLNTDRGEIVGTGADAEHKWHGLIINRFTGVAARFDCDGPGSETVVNATHNGGSVAGACVSNAYGPPEGRVSRGFIYRPQAGGERIFFQPGNNPEVTGINDDGGCVLTYNVMEIPNGPNGHYAAFCEGGEITLPIDPALFPFVNPTGRDLQGRVAGWFYTNWPETSYATGFLLDNGQVTFIAFPGGDSTALWGLSKTEILGQRGGSLNGAKSGGLVPMPPPERFVYDIATGQFFTLSLPMTSPGTTLGGMDVKGLNDNGEIIGKYTEVISVWPFSRTVWFIATPVPDKPLVVARVKKPKKR
jgi:hypothetical protein